MQEVPGVSVLKNTLPSFFLGIALLSTSGNLTAVETNEDWQGFPNTVMHIPLVCIAGAKQVEAETLAELYGALWIDQPEPTAAKDLKWGSIVKDEPVKFPRSVRGGSRENHVMVSVLINEKSEVVDAHVICSTDDVFNQSALNAATKSKYRPVYVNGKATLTHLLRPYRFSPER